MNSNTVCDQHVINGFAPVLTYAACEWFLIILMFIDALLSYLLVWFARYCRLQMPCFLCSKLLHPLHWRLLLCRNHKSEVSSFMSCHNHDNNLADCRGMCDDCLLSFTKTMAPNPDMNRLLLGKLGYDLLSTSPFAHPISCSCCNKPWRTRQNTQRLVRLGSGSRGKNSASKPNIPAPRHPLTRRGSGSGLKKMMRDHKATSDAEYVDTKMMRDHKATSDAEYVDTGSRSDSMAHVGYKELKIHSDLESEYVFTDDEAFVNITDFDAEPKRVRKRRSLKRFKDKKMSNRKQPDLKVNKDKNIRVQDNETAESSMPERNFVDKTHQQPVETEKHEARPFSLGLPQEDDAGTSLHKENKAEVSGNSSPSEENSASREIQIQEHDDSTDFAQHISDSDVKIEASEADMEQKVSNHTDVSGSVADKSSSDEENGVAGHFEPLASSDMPISMAEEQSSEVNEKNVAEESFSNEEEDEVNGNSETSTSKNVSGSFTEEQSSEEEDESNDYLVSTKEGDADNGDSEHLTSNNVTGSATEEEQSVKEEHEDHEKLSEPLNLPEISKEESSSEHSDKHSSEVKETQSTSNRSPELEHSASVESFVTGSATEEEQSAKEDHGGDEKLSEPLDSTNISNEESSLEHSGKDSSEVKETQNTSKKSPELKHSASVESFVSINSDVEGESHVDLLKKQLEHERKCLRDLTKELEEERNASAVATDEAMAMITRLQEEKAALHMEVLQYLRMMDEQAEHDVDALEKANDVLADKEKEIQDLEMELEYYRVKYPDEPREEIFASMGILDSTETSGIPTTDETSEKVPTDTELTGSPSAEV